VIDRVVDVHIGKLRQKIEKDRKSPLHPHVRGMDISLPTGNQDEGKRQMLTQSLLGKLLGINI